MPFAHYVRSNKREEDKRFDVDKVNRSIANAEKRIEDAGYTKADTDKRNWFEKLTNLPQGQNAFFDVLELLGRPGTGVVNAVNEAATGGNAGTGFFRGFAGLDRTRGADLAETLGVEDKIGKFILGTALDIGLDPLTYVPGGVIAKGVSKTASGVRSAANAGINALERRSPGFSSFMTERARPAADSAKDALGRLFVPDYKLGEDLYGQVDDAVLRAKQAAENDIAFRTDEAMKGIADAAKLAGGVNTGTDVGRIMESGLKQFDEAGNVLPRSQRDLPSDPGIRQAADNLMRSNAELREWAAQNGVEVGEIEGYMTHILSQEERKRRKNVKAMPIDRGNFGTGQPNKSILNERTQIGSVEDINERIGREFFEPNAFFSTAVGQKRLIEYANAVKFRGQVLSNPNFAQKYEPGMQIPKNAVVIDTNNYKFINNDANEIAEEVGGQYVVTKSVKTALDRYKKLTSDEGINQFVKALDTATSFWKRGALFSIPYHLRNIAGAMFNNYVGGMNTVNLAKYTGEGYKEAWNAYVKGQESPMFREFREQGLGSSGQLSIEFARRGEEPEEAIRRTIEKRSKQDGTIGTKLKTELSDLKNPLNAFESSRQFGDFNDQAMRFAMYKWARDKGLTPEQAASKVREVQFDYSRTTPFEREFATRALPFYRWMRNNLPFQLRQFINDPRKYANVNKIRLNAQEAVGLEDENIPDWMKENFAIPIMGDEGQGRFLGLNLPLGDLTKVSNPLDMLTNAITPFAKLPFEVANNRNFFFDKPIEKFEGQEVKFEVPDNIYGIPIPGSGASLGGIDPTLLYIIEQLGGQPVREARKLVQPPSDADQDQKFRDPGLGISSILKEFDAEAAQYYQQLEQLRKLQDLIDYIEQQTGTRPRTVQEINRAR